ncbi:unnamed protein product [Nippostrongylus brasiliensis]|uniref:Uncharacterized protein n=1 Tax=Nippostrongylus brasiliensis TaxID=27835 RepID=A0A0N4XUW2_NIPBR|nr:unnamed protein product [Nippostrongylus brasiliensis]
MVDCQHDNELEQRKNITTTSERRARPAEVGKGAAANEVVDEEEKKKKRKTMNESNGPREAIGERVALHERRRFRPPTVYFAPHYAAVTATLRPPTMKDNDDTPCIIHRQPVSPSVIII